MSKQQSINPQDQRGVPGRSYWLAQHGKAVPRALSHLAACLVALVLLAGGSARATTVSSFAGTCTSTGSTGWPWLNYGLPVGDPGSDTNPGTNVGAQANPTDGSTSDLLLCTNFGFTIPAGSIIQGITLTVTREGDDASWNDGEVRIVKAGVLQTVQNKAVGTAWNLSSWAASAPYGGSSDLWGVGWTAADINDSGIGAALSVTNNTGDFSFAGVRAFQITVDYTTPPNGVPVAGHTTLVLMVLALGVAGVLLLRRGVLRV
jgi:hypothetical protein